MECSRRDYRKGLCPHGMASFTVAVKETDLWVAVEKEAFSAELPKKVEEYIFRERCLLESYLRRDPGFAGALAPYLVDGQAPPMVLEMARAGNMAGVGPMAAVAGAFAQAVGRWLLAFSSQVIVENGGDIFLRCDQAVKVRVLVGDSPFSQRLFLILSPRRGFRGICTSSGTIGPSYSQGRSDAAVVLAESALLADAVATAAANRVRSPADLQESLQFTRQIPGVQGALLVMEDKLAAWGDFELEEG